MKKFIITVIVIALLIGLGSCEDKNNPYSDYDNIMGSQDWGDDYFYNFNSHQVERKLFH